MEWLLPVSFLAFLTYVGVRFAVFLIKKYGEAQNSADARLRRQQAEQERADAERAEAKAVKDLEKKKAAQRRVEERSRLEHERAVHVQQRQSELNHIELGLSADIHQEGVRLIASWPASPAVNIHVVKQVNSPLTSDIASLLDMVEHDRQSKNPKVSFLVNSLNKAPVEIVDTTVVTGENVTYYAWLSSEVEGDEYRWALQIQHLHVPREKDVPSETASVEDVFADGLKEALAGVVSARVRRDKMDEFVDKFVAEHGMEDDEEELAAVAEQFLARHEKWLNEKGPTLQ